MAGVTGFEPMMTESESVALPLGDTPLCLYPYSNKNGKFFQVYLTAFYYFIYL